MTTVCSVRTNILRAGMFTFTFSAGTFGGLPVVIERMPLKEYSLFEFVQEFFSTLFEILLGLINAFMQIARDVGSFKVILAGYVFLLLLAVVSELKKNQRRRELEHRRFQAVLEERRVEEMRRQEERDERLAQYKQRSVKKKPGQKVPPQAVLNYQSQRITQNQNSTVRGR